MFIRSLDQHALGKNGTEIRTLLITRKVRKNTTKKYFIVVFWKPLEICYKNVQ